MPYNEEIETRVRRITSNWENTDQKNMFGGICHLMNGNMFGGVYKDFLILRIGEEKTKEALALPFVREFDITGRPMKGWIMVERAGFVDDEALADWLNQAKEFVSALPAK